MSSVILTECLTRLETLQQNIGISLDNHSSDQSVSSSKDKANEHRVTLTEDNLILVANTLLTDMSTLRERLEERNLLVHKGRSNELPCIKLSQEIRKSLQDISTRSHTLSLAFQEEERQIRNKMEKQNLRTGRIAALESLLLQRANLYTRIRNELQSLQHDEQTRATGLLSKTLPPPSTGSLPTTHTNTTTTKLHEFLTSPLPAPSGPSPPLPVRLSTDRELRGTASRLDQADQEIHANLSRLLAGVRTLGEHARSLGEEVVASGRMAEATQGVLEKRGREVGEVRERTRVLVHTRRPHTVLLTVLCGVLLLSVVGYFIYEFRMTKG